MISSRRFMLVAYPESFPDMPEFIRYCGADRWAYVLHDQDVNFDGTLDKPHWQIYLAFENERQSNVIASMFHVADNVVEKARGSEKSCIQYLIHLNEDPKVKHHYDVDEIVAFNIDVLKYCNAASEAYQAGEIIKIIEFHSAFPKDKFSDVVKDCISQGLYASLRRGNAIFQSLWREARASLYEETNSNSGR